MKPALIVIGLGNPGASYAKTRHNVGFQAVEMLAKDFGGGEFAEKRKFSAEVSEGHITAIPVLFVKPLTYMNLSGESAKKVKDFYSSDGEEGPQVLVLCDDIDLPLGELRLRESGGPGTHNGLKSIVEHIGEGFVRIRIGLGEQPPGADLSAWVLSVPSKEEGKALHEALAKIPAQVEEFVLGSR